MREQSFGLFKQKFRTAQLDNGSKHSVLIKAIHKEYAPGCLPGFEPIYIDNGNGSRIIDSEKEILRSAGVVFELNDRLPDLFFWSEELDALWIFDAVTTDGEVDYARQQGFIAFAKINGKNRTGLQLLI
ncbi:BsuBI/PstI family type II restriction endonuclease [Aliivibrio sp.]|uniref:BsuBI/PstI family type II restriction endonuclease n=1 Tax=Aliivibrio sp. TaxID=1872443 RepID=UPI003D2F4D20